MTALLINNNLLNATSMNDQIINIVIYGFEFPLAFCTGLALCIQKHVVLGNSATVPTFKVRKRKKKMSLRVTNYVQV